MPLQYIQDSSGATTAVIIPIEEWNKITEKYSDVEELPEWQKKSLTNVWNSIASTRKNYANRRFFCANG